MQADGRGWPARYIDGDDKVGALTDVVEGHGICHATVDMDVSVDRRHATLSLNDGIHHYMNGVIILGAVQHIISAVLLFLLPLKVPALP